MKVITKRDPTSLAMVTEIHVDRGDQIEKEKVIMARAIELASKDIAKMFVKKYGQRIMKGMHMAQVFKQARDIAAEKLSEKIR